MGVRVMREVVGSGEGGGGGRGPRVKGGEALGRGGRQLLGGETGISGNAILKMEVRITLIKIAKDAHTSTFSIIKIKWFLLQISQGLCT